MKGGCEPGTGHGHYDSDGSEALARRKSGQLVFPYCGGGSG